MCEQPSSAPLTPVIYTVDVRAGTFRRHDPAQPVVFWDDAAVTRGEAVFESLLVRNGRAANLQRHLDRLQRSAQRMDLPAPDRAVWQQVTAAAVADWQEQSGAGKESAPGPIRADGSTPGAPGTPETEMPGTPQTPERVLPSRRRGW